MCCIFCWGISPEPATKHVTFEAVVEDASPRHLLFKGVFTKGTLVDGVTVANHPHACCPVLSPGCHSRHRRWARRNFASLGGGPVFPVLIMPIRCTLTIDRTIRPTSG